MTSMIPPGGSMAPGDGLATGWGVRDSAQDLRVGAAWILVAIHNAAVVPIIDQSLR